MQHVIKMHARSFVHSCAICACKLPLAAADFFVNFTPICRLHSCNFIAQSDWYAETLLLLLLLLLVACILCHWFIIALHKCIAYNVCAAMTMQYWMHHNLISTFGQSIGFNLCTRLMHKYLCSMQGNCRWLNWFDGIYEIKCNRCESNFMHFRSDFRLFWWLLRASQQNIQSKWFDPLVKRMNWNALHLMLFPFIKFRCWVIPTISTANGKKRFTIVSQQHTE